MIGSWELDSHAAPGRSRWCLRLEQSAETIPNEGVEAKAALIAVVYTGG